MKRILLLLALVALFVGCQRAEEAPQTSGGFVTGPTKPVALELSGSFDLPYDDLGADGKALTLEPGTKAGKSVLTPTYQPGEEIQAWCYLTTEDKMQTTWGQLLTLHVGADGKTVYFHDNINIPAGWTAQKYLISLFIGFDTSMNLKEWPTEAPYYAPAPPRDPITGFPIALEARGEVERHTQGSGAQAVTSYRNLALQFKLVGSLIRCQLTNDTDEELTVEALELHGLGATGVKLAQAPSGADRRVFVTSDATDPQTSVRRYNLPAPVKLAAGQKDSYYLVYAPLVSGTDGRAQEYKGYIRPILSDPTKQADYADAQTAKALSNGKAGKLALTEISLSYKSPIQPNAIPLQYWNNYVYYKPEGQAPYAADFNDFVYARPTGTSSNFSISTKAGKPLVMHTIYFLPNEVTTTHIENLHASLHIPTPAELDGILPPGVIEPDPSQDNLPIYYREYGVYSKDGADDIEVAGERFAGHSSYWRSAIDPALPPNVMPVLFWQGGLSPEHPIYALRYGKLSDDERKTYIGKKFKGKELAKDNKSRVAYMYIYEFWGINIYSCYIGEDSDIQKAEDLYTKNVFRNEATKVVNSKYGNRPIYRRRILSMGARYSTKAVSSGASQFPARRNNLPSLRPNFTGTYTTKSVPTEYQQSVTGNNFAPSGLLRRKSRTDATLEGVWFYRNDEGQLTSPSLTIGYVFKDTPRPDGDDRYFIRELPTGDDRYFAFYVLLMSDLPRINP